jgi:hypothetical protein
VIGIPALIAFVFLTWQSVRFHMLEPAPGATGATGNQLIDLFVLGARWFGKIFEIFGGAVKWAMTVLAIGAFVVLVIAAVAFFTAKGLYAGRGWARVMGLLIAIVPLLVSMMMIASVRRPLPVAAAMVTAAASGYVIWTLGWRFSD